MEKKILKIIEDQNELLKRLLEVNYNKKSNNDKKRTNLDDVDGIKIQHPQPKLKKIQTCENIKPGVSKSIKLNTFNKPLLDSVKNKPILICSTQYPGYGGGATNSYNIHKFLDFLGFTNVLCIFFVHEKFINKEGFDHNPDKISKTIYFNRKGINDDTVRGTILKTLNIQNENEIIAAFTKNIWASNYVLKIYPNIPVIYLVSGSAHITDYVSKNNSVCFEDIKKQPHLIKHLLSKKNESEESLFSNSKYVCCNSENSFDIMKEMYPSFTNISRLFTTYITVLVMSYITKIKYGSEDKVFDIIYAVSNYERNIKGPVLASKIFKHLESVCKQSEKKLNVCIIGNNNHILDLKSTPYVTYNLYDCKPNAECITYMYNSRLILIPSLYEACPNTMHESILLGLHVVTSKNVGSYEILDNKNIVQEYHDVDEWVDKINNLLAIKEFEPDLSYCNNIITDILKLLYECSINKIVVDVEISYKNRFYLDYDFLKMFGLKVITTLLDKGYKVLIPEFLFGIYSKPGIDEKYISQCIKLVSTISPLMDKYKSNFESITRSQYLKYIQERGGAVIFSNFKNASKYFIKNKIVDKVTKLHSTTEKNLVINLQHPNNQIENIIEFLEGIDFDSVFIISSLTKII